MGSGSMLSVRSPLAAKLDGKAFVQLTLWFVVVIAALALGKYLFGKAQGLAAQAMPGTQNSTGTKNPFASLGA